MAVATFTENNVDHAVLRKNKESILLHRFFRACVCVCRFVRQLYGGFKRSFEVENCLIVCKFSLLPGGSTCSNTSMNLSFRPEAVK